MPLYLIKDKHDLQQDLAAKLRTKGLSPITREADVNTVSDALVWLEYKFRRAARYDSSRDTFDSYAAPALLAGAGAGAVAATGGLLAPAVAAAGGTAAGGMVGSAATLGGSAAAKAALSDPATFKAIARDTTGALAAKIFRAARRLKPNRGVKRRNAARVLLLKGVFNHQAFTASADATLAREVFQICFGDDGPAKARHYVSEINFTDPARSANPAARESFEALVDVVAEFFRS